MINTFAHPAGSIRRPKSLEEFGDEVARNPVGTGPFKFVEWNPSEGLEIVKNEEYWNGRLSRKLIQLRSSRYPKMAQELRCFKQVKQISSIPVPTEQADSINGKNGIEVESNPSIIVRYMAINTLKNPYNDVKVRHALNLRD